jgi:monothiol glutaredoxin
MARPVLDEAKIHPAIRDRISNNRRDVVKEVQDAVAGNAVVVVGMGMNPFPKKARKLLDEAGVAYKYLGYGSYLNTWRERGAIKMWTGWPTIPQIFVKGSLIGGADDLQKLIASGELKTLLA